MQGLILAAGRGSRLSASTNGTPKCLVEVGRRPIIEHQLEMLSEAGVGPIGMVVGYGASEIRQAVGIRAEYIENVRWNSTNSMYSFHLAEEWVEGPLLILNCDILFHPQVLDRLLESGEDSIAFDSSSGDGREHMKLKVRDGFLVDLNKDLPAGDAAGENVGILYLSAKTARALFERAQQRLEEGGEKDWLGAAVREIAGSRNRPGMPWEHKIKAVDIAGLPWVEIDFPFDLDRARKEVWPDIERNRRVPTRRSANAIRATLLLLLVIAILLGIQTYQGNAALNWEPVTVSGGTAVTIESGGRVQSWTRVKSGESIECRIAGRATVRIESRPIFGAPPREIAPYVVAVRRGGKTLDWYKKDAKPSRTWKLEEGALAKNRHVDLELLDGPNDLSITYLGPSELSHCLLRVRVLESLDSGDD